MIPDDGDDGPVTEADLAAARERWADAQHEPHVRELFSAPVYAPGFRGDLPVSAGAAEKSEA